MKASFPRIVGLNLVILIGVAVALRIQDESSQNEVDGLGFAISFAFAIALQFLLNVLLGLIARSEATKQSFWTAALVTLLVGFGACVGGSLTYFASNPQRPFADEQTHFQQHPAQQPAYCAGFGRRAGAGREVFQ